MRAKLAVDGLLGSRCTDLMKLLIWQVYAQGKPAYTVMLSREGGAESRSTLWRGLAKKGKI